MWIFIACASIVAITFLAWIVRRTFGIRLCPICGGVLSTWVWMLLAREFGVPVDPLAIALLLGGSVVGITYQLERNIRPQSVILFKVGFIPLGFAAGYSLLSGWLVLAAGAVALMALITYIFRNLPSDSSPPRARKVEDIEEKMKRCC